MKANQIRGGAENIIYKPRQLIVFMAFFVSLELASITAKVLFILMIGWLTRKRFTFAGAISNGVLMILGGGTLLWS